MDGQNYAGNIIVNLSSLPDFLRKPILRRRMAEFFTMPEAEKDEIVQNALEAGPGIPFHSFARLFQTWLEGLCALPAAQREELLSRYVREVARNPQKLAPFNLDGMLESYRKLGAAEMETVGSAAGGILSGLEPAERRIMLMMIPDGAKPHLNMRS